MTLAEDDGATSEFRRAEGTAERHDAFGARASAALFVLPLSTVKR